MDWFSSFIKVAGASFPVTSSFVQLLSELESREIQERIRNLEDPISKLHPNIHELSELLYETIWATDESHFDLPNYTYEKFSRALSCLESEGLVKGHHAIGNRYAAGIAITDPSYIIYMCALFEDAEKMEKLYQEIDGCSIGSSLDGKEIKQDLGLPLPVISAGFQIFEAKGYGICSQETGSVVYIGNT